MLCVFQKYVAVGEFGKATDTLDATGSVTLEKGFGKFDLSDPSTQQDNLQTSLSPLPSCLSVSHVFIHFLEHITRLDVEEKLKAFTGDIMQVPPL